MICPNCGSEYREGFVRCADCDVDLVAAPSGTADDHLLHEKLVKVWEGGNPALIPLIESVLRDAGIEFMTSSENLQDLFGWGRVGGGYNYVIGPIMFYVRPGDEAEAARLLETLKAEPLPPEVDESDAPQ